MRTTLCAFAAMAVLSTGATAGSFSHLDRSDDAEIHSHTALSHDIYVKGFGLALGMLRADPQTETETETATQADAGTDKRALGNHQMTAAAQGFALQPARRDGSGPLPLELLAASVVPGSQDALAARCWKPASALAPGR